jgi:hypothetical protein
MRFGAKLDFLKRRKEDFALTYVHADIVKTIQSADGRAKVDFLRRNDGLYEYRGYIERRFDDGPYKGDRYWSPAQPSGLYQTLDELEQAARQALDWLRGVVT